MTGALLITWDGGGNLPPALGIGRELARRGMRVRVLGNAVQRDAVTAAGLEFIPFTHGRDHISAEPRGTVDGVLRLVALFADRGIARDAEALLTREPADVVLVDCLLWGAMQQLTADGHQVVNLVHSMAGYFDGNARGPVGMLARLRGADGVAAARDAALTLVTTRADFESGPRSDETHTGFVWQGTPVEAVGASIPRVLISFSTTVFPGQRAALQRAIDALAHEDLEVIVTTGAVDPAELRAGPNTTLLRRRDHGEILPSTSLVIGHGGHATTARALSAGIPVLVIPMHPLMDQPAVGRAVERIGAGATLPKTASPLRIRAAALRLLSDDTVRATARRIGEEARELDGAVVAADALLSQGVPQS
jgi:UDP:flavonoid glycosyltransferase YjiC (YdhE family)